MNVSNFIDALGGTTRAASLLGAAPSAISNWRARNQIPARYWKASVEAASDLGISGVTLDVFAAAASKDAA